MTVAKHPKKYKQCPECKSKSFAQKRKVKQIGQTYECNQCGIELFVYDNSSEGMGESLTWQPAQPVIDALGHKRECLDCGHKWHYGGTADRPTCPKCKGKRTQPVPDDD